LLPSGVDHPDELNVILVLNSFAASVRAIRLVQELIVPVAAQAFISAASTV